MENRIAVLFTEEYSDLNISINRGKITSVIESEERVEITVEDGNTSMGAEASVVTVRYNGTGFSFFLRDVNKDYPVIIPEYKVAVTGIDDNRTYSKILKCIKDSDRKSAIDEMEQSDEESFEHSAKLNRSLKAATWLGISRDIRLFEVGVRDYKTDQWDSITRNIEGWDTVSPRTFGGYVSNDELPTKHVKYVFMTGRGVGCESNVKRKLEKGYLPILHQTNEDNGIYYHTTYFATNEFTPLRTDTVCGTEMYAADAMGGGANFTDEQRIKADASSAIEKMREDAESVVMHIRISMKNTEVSPRYAFVHLPDMLMFRTSMPKDKSVPEFDSDSGLGIMPSGLVYLTAKADNGAKLQNEMSILLFPGDTVNIDCVIPHSPLPRDRGEKLLNTDFDEKLDECRNYWKNKLSRYGTVSLPEKRINDMVIAGLIHLELVMFGKEPYSEVVPAVGKYTAIGSESSPVIQFIDTMGNSQLAERAIDYFLEKQREDGSIQNYLGYKLETGYVLYTMGEHYLYTRDNKWAKRVSDKVIAACEYNISLRNNNLDVKLKKHGYGMISGSTDDIDCNNHSYMLNAGMYAGFKAASVILDSVNPEYAEKYRKLAEECKNDIIESLNESLITSPVIPMKNGCWIPSFASYPEVRGAAALYCKKGNMYSHGTFNVRELSGADYLPFMGVTEYDSLISHFTEEYWADFLCNKNSVFSQPYYSPHSYINLMNGHVNSYLSEFYNSMSALADRETYTFLEHFFEASVHKTHEEAEFLMRIRRMLWVEDGSSLYLLRGVPRKWLENGNKISATDVNTKFGMISFDIKSDISEGKITASVKMIPNESMPDKIAIRLPHPVKLKAVGSDIGIYDEDRETVTVEPTENTVHIILNF